jgi:NAD/NADP transhydrogenase alpha subunit
MTVRIENGRLVGSVTYHSQFLNGSPDCTKYPVKCTFDGADLAEVVRRAYDAAVIVLRKRIKTKAQAEALAEGITFMNMVAAQPKDATTQLTSVNVDEVDVDAIPDSLRQKLIEKLMSRQTGDNTNHVVSE